MKMEVAKEDKNHGLPYPSYPPKGANSNSPGFRCLTWIGKEPTAIVVKLWGLGLFDESASPASCRKWTHSAQRLFWTGPKGHSWGGWSHGRDPTRLPTGATSDFCLLWQQTRNRTAPVWSRLAAQWYLYFLKHVDKTQKGKQGLWHEGAPRKANSRLTT